ncbi:hypothetical protein BU25DRAFT_410864 [Macroventuria anomochaeta]|uniref:Uncharacterized protein n=1 Tax=Macroventuria anomochaeta TaxID=301207 RepID=A0ACB6S2I8_9PLEO|nr:uncharacterized protein BU25DRAFT_410864 [Macroventuria anomochaeta]KAF2627732.1 hypothetical protein BU25DRAFT_410864 [Macroventuria anomochaeta]
MRLRERTMVSPASTTMPLRPGPPITYISRMQIEQRDAYQGSSGDAQLGCVRLELTFACSPSANPSLTCYQPSYAAEDILLTDILQYCCGCAMDTYPNFEEPTCRLHLTDSPLRKMQSIEMESPRDSMVSHRSNQSTAFDLSAPPSPKDKLGGHGERRAFSEVAASKPQSALTEDTPNPGPLAEQTQPAHDRPGWPRLAEVMSQVPEFAAFPRFRELNVKNLLYYQVELELLRQQIEREEEEEMLNVERYDRIVKGASTEYHKLLIKLRILLREYNEALLQLSQVSALSDPEEYNMRSLRNWLSDAKGGDGAIRDVNGTVETYGDRDDIHHTSDYRTVLSALLWAKPPPKGDFDLVVTHPEAKIDGLTKWTVYYLYPYWWSIRDRWRGKFDEEAQRRKLNDKKHPEERNTVERKSEGAALRLTSSLSTIVACLIPVVAIVVLKQLSRTRDLLLCITGFAIFFAAGLIFLTQGTSSRTEIFAATAAFSAVMVVFISQPIIQVPLGSEV